MARRARDEDPEGERRTRGLAALALVLALALAASYLVERLRKNGEIEDCLMAQRTDCDILVNGN